MVRLLRAGLVVALVSAVAACGSSPSSSSGSAGQPRLLVVTTTTQVTDFARNVGGDHVDVHAILKANVDPHDYEPSAADLVALSEADVIVKNGVGLESWFDSTIKSAEPRGTIVDASAGVEIREGNGTDEESAGDPHIWHDPTNAKIMATNIAAALAAADPPDATVYQPNLASVLGPARRARRRHRREDRHADRTRSSSPTTTRSATTCSATGSTSSAR